MIPLIAALLVALAIYSNAKLLQNHFFFQNYSSKISIKKIRNPLPLCRSTECIQGNTRSYFVSLNFFKNTNYQPARYKENEFVTGFV